VKKKGGTKGRGRPVKRTFFSNTKSDKFLRGGGDSLAGSELRMELGEKDEWVILSHPKRSGGDEGEKYKPQSRTNVGRMVSTERF